MNRSSLLLRFDAQNIWQAGVDAVQGERLVRDQVRVDEERITFGNPASHVIPLDSFDRIFVLGGGKAAAGMAQGIETALAPVTARGTRVNSPAKLLTGWVNVPDDCVTPSPSIHIHAARPAGRNEPTAEGVTGTAEMLRRARELGPRDLCIALISGGGSALMPAPVEGITLADKLAITRLLSHNGADIRELNTVRKHLSQIKGGGLARACGAGQLVTLIISDVLGDPLDIIASGPTVADQSTPIEALAVLEKFAADSGDVPASIWKYLRDAANHDIIHVAKTKREVTNLVLANNHSALHASAALATQLGYAATILPTNLRESSAENVAQQLVRHAQQIAKDNSSAAQPICLLSGGEPVVHLAEEAVRGRGGRNQQLVLAALQSIIEDPTFSPSAPATFRLILLSAGTDGEDGPTDAAGAMLWPDLICAVRSARLDLDTYLQRNDAYSLLDPLGALIQTGPTQTNVCDVRVILIIRD